LTRPSLASNICPRCRLLHSLLDLSYFWLSGRAATVKAIESTTELADLKVRGAAATKLVPVLAAKFKLETFRVFAAVEFGLDEGFAAVVGAAFYEFII